MLPKKNRGKMFSWSNSNQNIELDIEKKVEMAINRRYKERYKNMNYQLALVFLISGLGLRD